MANKRNDPKPGSKPIRGMKPPWETDTVGTFRDMVHALANKNTGRKAASGEALPWTHGWGKKAKTAKVYAFTGNNGHSAQLPLKTRKANVLQYLQTTVHQIYVKDIEPTVLKGLIDDGDVYIENGKSGHIRQSHSYAVPTEKLEIVEGKAKDPNAKWKAEAIALGLPTGDEKVETKKILWTKEKDQQLLIDMIKGEADPELVKEVNRTKTKMRKITVPKK